MAINKNHEFEELNGVKCGIVERGVPPARAAFLQHLLEWNGYTVQVAATPVKVVPAKPAAPGAEPAAPAEIPLVAEDPLFTVGVTDYTFNPINAIFGRLLKAPNGAVVTLAYWRQQEPESNDDVPYFDHNFV